MSMEKKVCLYFQKGYCKFGLMCKLEHKKDICEKENCEIEYCIMRHPRKCKFFALYGNCKFGNYCAYLHTPSEDKEKMIYLEKVIQETNSKIVNLEEEIISLKMLVNSLSDFNNTIETLWSSSSLEETEVNIQNGRCEPYPAPNILDKNINDDKWITSAFPAVADPSSTTFFGYPNNYKSYGLMVNYSF